MKHIFGFTMTAAAGFLLLSLTAPSQAQEHTLRIQTHFPAESTPGSVIKQFIDDVETMSAGRLRIQMHYSSEVVAQNETLGAVSQGILDCDMTGISGHGGKDAGWQFAGDIMGGYDTPYQFLAWLDFAGGRELVQSRLYDPMGVHLVGYWLQGHESLSSTRSLAGFADLKDWKFRSPPGLETEIFASFGAKPIVMDFGEVPNALRTGIVDGADASTLNTNDSLGLFDIAEHATFPGFHSMPTETLSCNKAKWNALPADIQRMMHVAIKRAALDLALQTEIKDKRVANKISAAGVTLHDWSTEDRKEFRSFARSRWDEWKPRTPAATAIVDSHIAFMRELGLID
ncbi:MAG: TRAP transporter substrate-binding protein DctP [Alphaproteobacteria bacterium]|nr:TRAP transporter substrate-binding protein DctP [Alphaproteobacteria bacterium]MDA7983918.1 TRAP transporter substrate-binding protein DctP [Alphaproteobacteria bacterium]MDA7988215.1 TRAP transporter substrate-binding protein DctP [Alphaproteobacteria bacterium]MDA8000289.1 TRAP transporter substrate-binding protein DctP [Alphaproteobacteria bacterium]MDA8003396.1 TRAP transporter substrate-binding protein DctP [Alphaproteobacteria bacterium]